MSNSFYPLLGLLRIVIVAGLSGLTFATLLFKEKINAGLLLLGATLGLAVYSLIFTVAGLLGFLQNPDVLFIFVCGLLIFLVPLQLLLKRNRLIWPKATFTDWKAPNIPTLIILWLVIIFQILMLVNATAPHINQDTETYHYVFLRQFIESGTISIDPENAYSYYPMSIQMMVAAAFNLAGDRGPEAANLCYWFMQVLLLLWLVDFNARRGRPDIGWFTAAAVCGIFYWPVIAYSGYIDGGVALFAVAGVLSYFDWLENRTENKTLQLICTAIFLGIAISGKYSALAVAAMVIVHFLWVTLTSRESGHIKWKTILIALLFFIIPIIPWYGRNLLLTGNPTFPFLHGIFGGPELTLADDIGTWANWGIPVTLKNLLIYPLKLSFFFKLGDSFLRVPYMYMSWLFFLSPLAGLLLLHRRIERIVAIWCFIFFVFVFFAMNLQSRYFLPFTVLALWLIVSWLLSLPELFKENKLKKSLTAWIVFIIILIPFVTQFDLVKNHMRERMPYITGIMDRDEYELSMWPSVEVFNKANEVASDENKICVFGLRTYRLEVPWIFPPSEIFAQLESPATAIEKLKSEKVKYLMVENRIRMAGELLTWVLSRPAKPDGETEFIEGEMLDAASEQGLSRDLARELLTHLGGQRTVENNVIYWRIDLDRFRNPRAENILYFLSEFDTLTSNQILQIISQTGEWELYAITLP